MGVVTWPVRFITNEKSESKSIKSLAQIFYLKGLDSELIKKDQIDQDSLPCSRPL